MRLALVFHQHQPAGNFPSVFQEVTERAYAPLVAALYRHPEVKATLHFSGPLLDWLEGNRPDVIGDLADLVKRGQIELLSGGYYEPILVGVPRRDAVGQIRALTDRVAAIFGRRPLGAWLVVYADDGEKFGAWPGTYQRVHKDGWLEDFFSQIAQADFLETTTLEDAWIFQKPSRRVYLPGGTYHEMGEWSLEPAAARR